jgi:ribosomal protein S18 acetylase RimI-like enzyme
MSRPDEAPLENPVYSALCGPQARFAEARGRVRRYQPDVAPFLGLPAEPTAQDWLDAAELLGPGSFAAVALAGAQPPPGWRTAGELDLVQMVGEHARGVPCPEAVELGAEDVREMLELIARTEPGPFLARTVELGDYIGIHADGALVAMAGERMRVEGWTEISAVCTDPGHRGRGLASRLMGELVARIHARSEGVFLHALATNAGAIRLYQELGFRVRQSARLTLLGRA